MMKDRMKIGKEVRFDKWYRKVKGADTTFRNTYNMLFWLFVVVMSITVGVVIDWAIEFDISDQTWMRVGFVWVLGVSSGLMGGLLLCWRNDVE